MSLVVQEEGSIPIPEELAQEFGIHKGSQVEWERTGDGALKLRPALTRQEAVDRLRGLLKPYLHEERSGVEDFLKWREADAQLDGSR